jgi:hypothetical protein
MKRVVLFICLAITLDRGLGAILQRLNRRNFTGDRGGSLNYALTQAPEILVLGSSRAQFHIMPAVLREKLSMSAYNAGLKGQDFLYSVMLFDLWKRRHPLPRAVVLTIDIESLIERETEVTTAQIAAPYLDESPLVREVLYSASPFKRFQYFSETYRFNGEVISMARHLMSHPAPGFDGFAISPGSLDPATETGVLNALDQDLTAAEMSRRPDSPRKLQYLRALAEELDRGGTRFFLLHTPLYRQDPVAHQVWMDRLKATVASLPHVEIIDLCLATRPEIFSRPELYRNLNHVNVRGAEILTGLLAEAMKPRLAAPAQPPPNRPANPSQAPQ